ncbi:MAG: Uma2 family endonuclease [Crocosphaera sp.]|nr:Uma2 family endonuclease [Crocosphaera sp.]
MMVILPQIMSLEDYFNYEDETENRYELENGELLIMPPESDLNLRIASPILSQLNFKSQLTVAKILHGES